MLNEDLLARTQVAHLFLKAADQGVIAPKSANFVLKELFGPELGDWSCEASSDDGQSPAEQWEELVKAATAVLVMTDRDAAKAEYSVNVRDALARLAFAVKDA